MRTPSASFFVTLSSIQLPRSGMMRQLCSRLSPAFDLADEVDAGAAVQLADHDALGTVDDELAAAEHDRHVAEVDFFLDRLLFVQPQPDAERPAVGQPQLAAFVRRVARLAELVAHVLELERLVVALDREDLAQHAFDALILALLRSRCRAAETLRSCGSESRSDRESCSTRWSAAEATDFVGRRRRSAEVAIRNRAPELWRIEPLKADRTRTVDKTPGVERRRRCRTTERIMRQDDDTTTNRRASKDRRSS